MQRGSAPDATYCRGHALSREPDQVFIGGKLHKGRQQRVSAFWYHFPLFSPRLRICTFEPFVYPRPAERPASTSQQAPHRTTNELKALTVQVAAQYPAGTTRASECVSLDVEVVLMQAYRNHVQCTASMLAAFTVKHGRVSTTHLQSATGTGCARLQSTKLQETATSVFAWFSIYESHDTTAHREPIALENSMRTVITLQQRGRGGAPEIVFQDMK
jgi:hypothetical protein